MVASWGWCRTRAAQAPAVARRDVLTYDVDPRGNRGPVPWKMVALLAAVVVVAVVLCVAVVLGGRTPQAGPPAPSAPPSVAGPTSPSASPSATPGAGSDASEKPTAPAGSGQAVQAFVRAWLDRDPRTRAVGLRAVSVPALCEQLLLTDPANIPRAAPKGAVVMDGASAYSAQFTQTLSTGMIIRVYLTYDPQARFRWLATTVEEG
jgi:hypothetical protein